jgi:hypothetical protein
VGGGGGDYFGGDAEADPAKTLKEYRNSLAAATKESLVRSLARQLKARVSSRTDGGAVFELTFRI